MGKAGFIIKMSFFRAVQMLRMLFSKGFRCNGQVYLCCIGKNENKYAREFVEWYKNLGFSKIILYDNNDLDGERFNEVIGDYIQDGFVETVDFRGRKICQLQAYSHCSRTFGNQCDWIAFFDMDEFLELKDAGSVNEYLSDPVFENFGIIHINWKCFTDNGHLEYSPEPLNIRFTTPAPIDILNIREKEPENHFCKSFVRGSAAPYLWWLRTAHTPYPNVIRCCNNAGNPCNSEKPYCDIDYSCAWLRHYTTKSTQEYLQKLERGYPDHKMTEEEIRSLIEVYFGINEDTPEKREYIAGWMAARM